MIPLQNIPNQKISVHLEGSYFDLTFKEIGGAMYCTVERDGAIVIRNSVCLPYAPLIPYAYLEGDTGNFHFVTEGDHYPHYTRFASTDRLIYTKRADIDLIRQRAAGTRGKGK